MNNNSKFSPIIIFVYNRPKHTEQTVAALKNNLLASESDLFIFSDGPKIENDEKVREVRDYIKTIEGFKSVTITERDENLGLANSIISGATEIIGKFHRVIVLEDDLVTSKYFLKYMNQALEFFQPQKNVVSISGYNYPDTLIKMPEGYGKELFLSYRFGSWGWGTWKDRWEKIDWSVKDFEKFKKDKELQENFNRGGQDMSQMLIRQMNGDIDSWAIRFDYAHFKNNSYSVRPVKTLVANIGMDGSGVHCEEISDRCKDEIADVLPKIESLELDDKVTNAFRSVFDVRVLQHKKTHPKYSVLRFLRKCLGKLFR